MEQAVHNCYVQIYSRQRQNIVHIKHGQIYTDVFLLIVFVEWIVTKPKDNVRKISDQSFSCGGGILIKLSKQRHVFHAFRISFQFI